MTHYLRRNPQLILGISVLLGMAILWMIGYLLVDLEHARPLSALPDIPPSWEYLLGTDSAGRQMLPVMIAGIPMTLEIGLIAGTIGLLIGSILGFISGYFGGAIDTVIRGLADVALTVPALAVLVVIASVITQLLSVELMALIVASLAWMFPTRTIRAQVLSMREQNYIKIAQLSGMSNLSIVFREIMPNLLPYLAASFVSTVAAAVLAAIGLEALGLGPQSEPTLGMTIFWAIFHGAMLRGMWWWWAPPMVVIILLFIGLFLVAAGLDEWANPRVRRASK